MRGLVLLVFLVGCLDDVGRAYECTSEITCQYEGEPYHFYGPTGKICAGSESEAAEWFEEETRRYLEESKCERPWHLRLVCKTGTGDVCRGY